MKTISLIALALCTFAIACNPKDTETKAEWPRGVQPRVVDMEWQPCEAIPLTGNRIVPEVRCGAPAREATGKCEALLTSIEAARALARPECSDAAVEALEGFARNDPNAAVDLVAAYYVRAQRQDRPSDFLRALRAADAASTVRRDSPELQFDIALTQQALGLVPEARKSWEAYLALDGTSPWAAEARRHQAQLPADAEESEVARRDRVRAGLRAALVAKDARAIDRAIGEFPQTAQRYLDEGLLGDWAENPSAANLELARTLAAALTRRSGDRYPMALLAAIDRAAGSTEKLEALRSGHKAYAKARDVLSHTYGDFNEAARDLGRGGSPLRLMVQIRATSGMDVPYEQALTMLPPLIAEAKRQQYLSPLFVGESLRGYALNSLSRYFEALSAYDDAAKTTAQLRDSENIAATHTRRAGALRMLGDYDAAWRDAFLAIRDGSRATSARERHLALGEAAEIAFALAGAGSAVVYQDAAVRLTASGSSDEHVSALRGRAHYEIQLGRREAARSDLDEGFRLASHSEQHLALETRLHEVQGQYFLETDPQRAVTAFTEALAGAAPENATFRAGLLLQRSAAQLRANRPSDADRDLHDALDIVRNEETTILANRAPGEGDELWSAYFSRFQDAYRLYIDEQIQDHRIGDAFLYSERARAIEPLDLAMKRGVASEALRNLNVEQIRARLPADTFLIEYCVVEKQTYAWILSRDHGLQLLTLNASKEDISRWTDNLQRAAYHGDIKDFESRLTPPYVLIGEPLRAILRMHPQGQPHVVFVPDQGIFGLPLAALRDPKREKYLIEDVASVAVEPSAALYLYALQRDAELAAVKAPSILLVGDPEFDAHSMLFSSLKPLPGARAEVDAIAPVYPGADVRKGAQATLADFLEHARNKTIVHVAAHAIANPREPYRSLIALAADGNGEGAVTAQQLVTTVKLDRTRLVVLSACSSAGGPLIGPEGVGPLVRPWIAAGVPGVIGSLWDVDDATAGHLLVSFHQRYRDRAKNAAVALHDAQLELLRQQEPGASSAISWGSFQVIGHASSPSESPPHN